MTTLTHEDLRKAAVRWLTNSKKCSVVLSEMVSAAGEIPDAIGWKGGFSYVVECKARRSDFHANKLKCHERGNNGMGSHRYFLCTPDTVTVEDLAESDYGLLWIGEDGNFRDIRVKREPVTREPNFKKEISMLVSALRRVRTREFLTISISADVG